MSKIDDGGSAFPFGIPNASSGMSYRQWLAGLAMQGLLSNANVAQRFGLKFDDVVTDTTGFADALIAKLKERP